jgi:hypothetical protein
MINTFFSGRDTYKVKNRFGEFLYDIDINSQLPAKAVFDKVKAKEALFLIDDIFKAVDLRYFLIFGTLLGAIREKDFIVYDDDIDLGIYIEDTDKLINALTILTKDYGFVISKISTSCESVTIYYQNIIIDIGLFHRDKKVYIYNDFFENKIPIRFLDQLEKTNLFNREFLVPYDVENYLSFMYGKNWRVPTQKWNHFNKYINIDISYLRKIKQKLRGFKYLSKDTFYFIKFKFFGYYKKILKDLDIKNIKKVVKSGEGFCNTFIIFADSTIVLKVDNAQRFKFFKNSFKSVEPIYDFLPYKDRFIHEKDLFEKINNKQVTIFDNVIVFSFIESKKLSDYLYKDEFYGYLRELFKYLKQHNISHGDLHIDNILINKRIYLIDFEMVFSDYLTLEERYFYDIFYLFAKLEYQYPIYFDKHFVKLKEFVRSNFTEDEREKIIQVSKKCKRYFFSVNGARVELFV